LIKTPIPANEKERLNALHNYAILDSLSEDEFDRITELASLICDTPVALISFIDENRQWFKSIMGLSNTETYRDLSFCQYTIMDNVLLEVNDAGLDDRFKDAALVLDHPKIRFYAGYPLIDPNGYALGSLAVVDYQPRTLNDKQRRSLQLLAGETVALIIERRQKEDLRHFEKIFQLSNDLICINDSQGVFRKVNPSFLKILGWESSYLLGRPVFELIHPDDIISSREVHQTLLMGQTTIQFTHRLRTKDGAYKFIQWTITPEISTGRLFAIGRDVTDEKLKEERLASSEEKLRIFFENSQGLMCTHDLHGNFLSFNQSGASMLGYQREEICTMSLFDIVPEGRSADVSNYLFDIRQSGAEKGQMVLRHKNGSSYVWMFNNVLSGNNVHEQYVICNAADIDDRYHLINDLQRTREMLLQTNKVARVGGWELDFKTKEVYWTAVTKEMHGIDNNAMPGNVIDFYEGENRDTINNAVNLAATEGKSWDLELQIINTRGEQVWIRSIGHSEFENGVCQRIYGSIQDINEKKTAELEVTRSRKLLDDILNAATEVSIIATDLKGAVTVFNSGAERLLGYSEHEVLGKQAADIFHLPEEIEALDKEFSEDPQERLQGFDVFTRKLDSESFEQREFTYVRKDGAHCIVSLMGTPIRDADNQIIGYLGIAIDVTARVKQREELQVAKEFAEQANMAKSEFLANMSHEIRTPLNGIIGFTDLMLKTDLDERQRQYVAIVNQSADSLMTIINDILDFAKIEAGRMDLNIERCDIYQLASDATDIISGTVSQKGLEMQMNIAADLPRFVWADTIRLKQVLINLLGNASKFTERGGIELKVELLNVSGDYSTLRFGVRDTGIGISKENQKKIFEAFSQEDGSVTKRYGGTGLGLTISNKLLGLMGSQLHLKSTLGEGSLFYFDIIFSAQTGHGDEKQEAGIGENINATGIYTNPLTILIAEDNPVNMLLTKTVVKRIVPNARLVEAFNGRQALDSCSTGLPDLILMDIQMPDMNGYEATTRIRALEQGGHIPIIAVTASCLRSDKKRCYDAGMDDVVTKPFVEETIASVIHKWIFKNK
jgi:PAS domain S-box-containing protein